jgi:ParB-like chromosome segregation protein Spo0J
MAVDFKVEHTRTSEYLIPPKHIDIRPELNGREDATDVEDLIDSFADIGQLTPVDIGNNGGRPYLIFGHRRWRAAVQGIKNGKLPKDFKLRCVYFRGTPLDELKAVVAENLRRKGTSPRCDASNIARMERYGMTHEEIAYFYGQSTEDGKPDVGWVKRRLALILLIPDADKAVKDGRVKPNAVQVLAKLSREQQAEAIKAETVTVAACKAVVAGNGNGHVRGPSKAEALKATIARAAEGDLPVDVVNLAPVAAVMEFARYLMGGGR